MNQLAIRAFFAAGLAAFVWLAAGPGRAETGPLRAPEAPGAPVAGLRYFRLDPASSDTTWRLLVVPVRFPEDADLGLGRPALAERLNGEAAGSLRAYWKAATYGRLEVATTLAPTVTAAHPRRYYTSEGTGNAGFGIDPDAYPHNAQALVEEVTAAIADAVDLRRYDNNADGIVDGLLILHSGPRAPEVIEPGTSPDLLLAHAFTTSQPVARRDAVVFPYALASARDPLGPWAHEMGHLLGFPDEYVMNPLCFGEGLGEWSLMATGANREDGEDPSGLDAFCLELLGFTPAMEVDAWVSLDPGVFLRAYGPGAAAGPRYFLVERRTGANGLGLPSPATVVYFVNEEAVDNRSCTRVLVELRAVACASEGACAVSLTDSSTPDLRDESDRPSGLALDLTATSARARAGDEVGLRLERVRLLPVEAGGTRQRIELLIRNLDLERSVSADARFTALAGAANHPRLLENGWPRSIPPGGALLDSSWALEPFAPEGLLSPEPEALEFQLAAASGGSTWVDTLTFAAVETGIAAGGWTGFTSRSLDAAREDPWRREGAAWIAGPLARRAHGEVSSPWFTVPERGALAVDHAWDFVALSPDIALDGADLRVIPQTGPAVELLPPQGWGYRVERGTGNPLGGLEALSGKGDRIHVFDLAPWSGQTVRLSFRVAGDESRDASSWILRGASVASAPRVEGTLVLRPCDTGEPSLVGRLLGELPPGGADWIGLYTGPAWGTPPALLAEAENAQSISVSLRDLFAGDRSGLGKRCDLVWRIGEAHGTSAATLLPPPVERALLPPGPNPTRRGEGQTWVVSIAPGDRPGVYELALIAVTGRRILERELRIEEQGLREIRWDGRDAFGRVVPPGVYFLRCRRPDGTTESGRVVVLP